MLRFANGGKDDFPRGYLGRGTGKKFRSPSEDRRAETLEPLNPIGRVTPKGLMAQKGATIHEGCT